MTLIFILRRVDGFGPLDTFDSDEAMLLYGAWSVPFYHLRIMRAHPDTQRNPCVRSEREGEEVRTGHRKGLQLLGGRGEKI